MGSKVDQKLLASEDGLYVDMSDFYVDVSDLYVMEMSVGGNITFK